jgi:8-oxo-dGTP diphosphatase
MAVLEVAAGVIIRGDAVLVCQRAPNASLPLKWEFPGGKRQPHETLAECVRRELQEELAIDVVVGSELWRTRYHYRVDRPVDLFFFVITAFTGEPTNRVFAAIRWTTRSELPTLDFLDADRGLVSIVSGPPPG